MRKAILVVFGLTLAALVLAGCLQPAPTVTPPQRAACADQGGELCSEGQACLGRVALSRDSTPARFCCIGQCVAPGAATPRPTATPRATPAVKVTVAPTATPRATPAVTTGSTATPFVPTPTPRGTPRPSPILTPEPTGTPSPGASPTPTVTPAPSPTCVIDYEPCTSGGMGCCTSGYSCSPYGAPDVFGQRRTYCIPPTPTATTPSCIQNNAECTTTGPRCCTTGYTCQPTATRFLCLPAQASPTPTPTPTPFPCPSDYSQCAVNQPGTYCVAYSNQPYTCQQGSDALCWKCPFPCPSTYPRCISEFDPQLTSRNGDCDALPGQTESCRADVATPRYACAKCS